MIDIEQLRSIEPAIESAFESHLRGGSKPINPIELIQGASGTVGGDYLLDTGPAIRTSFEQNKAKLDELGLEYAPALSASYITNMLTELNLPHYTKAIDEIGRFSEVMNAWNGRWTSEEQPHEVTMRDYALFSGIMGNQGSIIHQIDYAQGGAQQLTSGTEISIKSLAMGFAYLSLQEDATFVAHNKESSLLDSMGRRIHKQIAGNETRHHRFYASMTRAMLSLYPDETVVAIRDVYHNFAMPGEVGIPHFNDMAQIIAISGLFGALDIKALQEKHIAKVYKIELIAVSSDEAKQAKEELLAGDSVIAKKAKAIDWLQSKKIETAKKSGKILPLVIGKTVQIDDTELVKLAA